MGDWERDETQRLAEEQYLYVQKLYTDLEEDDFELSTQ